MKPALSWPLFCIIGFSALILAGPVSAAGGDGWLPVTGPCEFTFPADHLAHDGYRTEWWYYTGNLADHKGKNFGFQLTFFRRGLVPPGPEPEEPVSAWRTSQIFLAHFAVSDLENEKHFQAEKTARPVLGLAGARPEDDGVFIHLNDWSAKIHPDGHHIFAKTPGFSLDLDLTPQKKPVAHGIRGYSQKGSRPEQASCYYSFTRLSAKGGLEINGNRHAVSGTAWMDHEFSSALLDKSILGWDWFGLQFSDQTEIMLFFLRKKDGTLSPASSGTFIFSDGKAIHLNRAQIKIRTTGTWTSPKTGAAYPSAWTLAIPGQNLNLEIFPNLANQEMITRTTGVTYWEGSVFAQGEKEGKKITGRGYVELTGYAGAGFEADL